MCCVSSISDVEFLWCEVVSDWDSLNWVIAWDVTALSFTSSGLSLQTCLVDNLRQLCHLRHLDVCRSMFCLDVSVCSASASSMTRSWWVHYCESIQRTQVQAATVQFLNRGHVWVVAILAQNLQDLLHHSFWSIGGSVEFCQAVNCVIWLPWCRFLLLMAPFRLWSWPPVSFTRHVWLIGVRSELCVHYIK